MKDVGKSLVPFGAIIFLKMPFINYNGKTQEKANFSFFSQKLSKCKYFKVPTLELLLNPEKHTECKEKKTCV